MSIASIDLQYSPTCNGNNYSMSYPKNEIITSFYFSFQWNYTIIVLDYGFEIFKNSALNVYLMKPANYCLAECSFSSSQLKFVSGMK